MTEPHEPTPRMTKFFRIERVLVDYLEGLGITVEHQNGHEWTVEIRGVEVSLTGLAVAVAEGLEKDACLNKRKQT